MADEGLQFLTCQPIQPKVSPRGCLYWENKPRLRSLICIYTLSFVRGTSGAYWFRFVALNLHRCYNESHKKLEGPPTFLTRQNRQARGCALGETWDSSSAGESSILYCYTEGAGRHRTPTSLTVPFSSGA
jgi:hypothetical protein